ncbi:hypothetical protein, partial [Escherichia coli]|uniref:hypothetical protein n=2 Tax=Escherichia coli TaxID=562 RepID=UPI0019D5D222
FQKKSAKFRNGHHNGAALTLAFCLALPAAIDLFCADVRAVLTGIPAAAARFGPGFSGKSKWFHQVTFLIFLMARYFPNTLFYRI